MNDSSRALRWVLALVAATLAAAIVLPGIFVPLHNVAEPLEGCVVQEMDASGDWILPRRNGEEIPAKPPLYHWITLGVAALRGTVDEVTIRIPSLAAAAVAVATTFLATSRVFGPVAGGIAALAVMTSPEWIEWAGYARTDALFCALLTIALFLGERWLTERSRGALLAAALALGGAVLAKGPAALVIAGAILLVELIRRGELVRLRQAEVWIALVLALGVAGSWYVAATLREGEAFFRKQILAENVFRFLPDDGGPSRDHGILFYFPALIGGMFPWALALPIAIRDAWREEGRRAALARYAVVWVVVVFVLCSLADGKRANYVLPLFPPAALLIGMTLDRLRIGGVAPRSARAVGAIVAIPLALVGVLLLAWSLGIEAWTPVLPFLHPRDRVNIPAVSAAIGRPPLVVGLIAIVLASALLATLRRRHERAFAVLLAGIALLLAGVGTAVLRPAEASLKSFRPFAERIVEPLGDGLPVRFYRRPDYSVLFYLRRHVPVEYVDAARLPRPSWVFVWEEDFDQLPADLRSRMTVVDRSAPTALHRERSRLMLAKLER